MTTARRRLVRRRTATLFAAAVLVAVVAAAAWIGVRGLLAKDELESAQALAASVQRSAAELDFADSDQVVQLAAHARRAADLTADPIWRAAEAIPYVGENLAAVRVVSAEFESTVTEALDPLLSAARVVSAGGRSADGAIDVEALSRLQEPISRAAAVLERGAQHLDGIDRSALLEPVREGVDEFSDMLAHVRPGVSALEDVASLLPPILGAEGPRTILVALQNNAELRTGGGITGSFVELSAEGGRVTISAQADSSNFVAAENGRLPVPQATVEVYGDGVNRFVQNASMTADFALTGELVSEWWSSLTGRSPDVVVVVDPVVLQAVLRVTGPIRAGGQDLAADDLLTRLLIEPYLTLGSDDQTALFRETAAAVFSRIMSTDVAFMSLAAALVEPVEEGRVSMWSAHEEEQEVIARTALAGPAARQARAGDDAFAVYLNDATGGKMDSFMDVGITWGVAECRADGHRDVVVSVTLTSTVSPETAADLPPSMTGGGRYGVRPGDTATNVSVSAPMGSYFGGVTMAGSPIGSAEASDGGFPVASSRVQIAPGESATVDFRFVSAAPRAVTPVLLHTPMLHAPAIAEAPISCP